MASIKQARTKRFSMGLEQLGMCLFEGASTTVTPAVVQGRVQHGLSNKEDIAKVEKFYGHKLDSDVDFWGTLVLSVQHTVSTLDLSSGEDILTIGVLKAQGKLSPTVADQDDPNENYQFVVVDEGAEATVTATLQRKRVTAMRKLSEIDEKDPDYMIALCKYMCSFQGGIKTKDQAFSKLAEFIEGKLTRKASEAVDYFLENIDPQFGGHTLKEQIFVRVDVEEAIKRNIIRLDRSRGVFTNSALPDSDYGRDKDAIVNFLLAITNADHLGSGSPKDEPYSIRLQLSRNK